MDLQNPIAKRNAYDVLLAADFTRTGDRAFRLALEIRAHCNVQSSVGLVQVRSPGPGDVIAPEIATCIRRDLARLVPFGEKVEATSMILHGPSDASHPLLLDSVSKVDELILVAHKPQDLQDPALSALMPAVPSRIFAVNQVLRTQAEVPLCLEDWLPVPSCPESSGGASSGRPLAVAWIATGGLEALDLAACSQPGVEHYGAKGTLAGLLPLPVLSLDRMVTALDVFVIAPAEGDHNLPDTLICAALMAGCAVMMPKVFQTIYGSGPSYFQPGELQRRLNHTVAAMASGKKRRHSVRSSFAARCRQSPAIPKGWRSRNPTQSRPTQSSANHRPLLCIASNGVGVGHLTRLLAIARRTPGPVVFVSHAPAVGVVRNFGYPVEYIPSPAAVGGDIALWDTWFKVHLDHLLDAWDPAVIAFDGNHLTPGLIAAVAPRRDCRLAWVRRGMWGNTTSAYLHNARWCDLVIEPGELAAERDLGVTTLRRSEALLVEPILLLDATDLLDRRQAAARLGLNPARPAAVIQLGSGHNRDLLSLLDQIITVLSDVPELQIAVAEWVNGSVPLTLWPKVTLVRGFPINQYVRAFDFCISAAGYNAFHELITFGLPTIFVANRHPTMDDQYGRARFAQDNAAAFEISENDLHDLPDLIRILMQEKARDFLAENCARMVRPNGAAEAASALTALASRS